VEEERRSQLALIYRETGVSASLSYWSKRDKLRGEFIVMLYEVYQWHGMEHQRVLFTIHNFKHQGIGGANILEATGLYNPSYYFAPDRLQDNFNPFVINFMKGGIVYSNYVNTVSLNHA